MKPKTRSKGIRCPKCKSELNFVEEIRKYQKYIRRRRFCETCREKFTTRETYWVSKTTSKATEKNPAHFCDCGKWLGHRGFCSDKCHNEHYDAEASNK